MNVAIERPLLLAVIDEIDSLSSLLHCQPTLSEATHLVRAVGDEARPDQRDRLAELAQASFGEDIDVAGDDTLRDAAADLIGVEDAVTACVIWRLERLGRILRHRSRQLTS